MTLIGYWPLNETSGSTAYDHSGKENHGGLNGGVTQGATGILGKNAYSFDGSDDNILTSSFDPAPKGIFTISLWVNPQETGAYVLSQGPDPDNNLAIKINSSSTSTWVQIGGNNDNLSGSSIPTNSWNHLSYSYDKNGQKRIYINGKLDTKASTSQDPSNIGSSNLGMSRWTGGGNQLAMKLSEVRIYNRILTPSEIQYLHSVSQRGRYISQKKTP